MAFRCFVIGVSVVLGAAAVACSASPDEAANSSEMQIAGLRLRVGQRSDPAARATLTAT